MVNNTSEGALWVGTSIFITFLLTLLLYFSILEVLPLNGTIISNVDKTIAIIAAFGGAIITFFVFFAILDRFKIIVAVVLALVLAGAIAGFMVIVFDFMSYFDGSLIMFIAIIAFEAGIFFGLYLKSIVFLTVDNPEISLAKLLVFFFACFGLMALCFYFILSEQTGIGLRLSGAVSFVILLVGVGDFIYGHYTGRSFFAKRVARR